MKPKKKKNQDEENNEIEEYDDDDDEKKSLSEIFDEVREYENIEYFWLCLHVDPYRTLYIYIIDDCVYYSVLENCYSSIVNARIAFFDI